MGNHHGPKRGAALKSFDCRSDALLDFRFLQLPSSSPSTFVCSTAMDLRGVKRRSPLNGCVDAFIDTNHAKLTEFSRSSASSCLLGSPQIHARSLNSHCVSSVLSLLFICNFWRFKLVSPVPSFQSHNAPSTAIPWNGVYMT